MQLLQDCELRDNVIKTRELVEWWIVPLLVLYGRNIYGSKDTSAVRPKEASKAKKLNRKRTLGATLQRHTVHPATTTYWTVCKSHVLIDTVRYDSIVQIEYCLLTTKSLKDDVSNCKYIKFYFIAVYFVYNIGYALNAPWKELGRKVVRKSESLTLYQMCKANCLKFKKLNNCVRIVRSVILDFVRQDMRKMIRFQWKWLQGKTIPWNSRAKYSTNDSPRYNSETCVYLTLFICSFV